MDAREALGHDAADAEIHRHECRVLARRALPVVAAADDDAVSGGLGTRREGRIADRKAELRQLRDVRAIRQDLCPGGHDVVGRDVVAHLEHKLRRKRVGKGLAAREGADVRPAQDLHRVRLRRRRGRQHGAVVDAEAVRQRDGGHLPECLRVGDDACERGGDRRLRRDEVDLCVLRAAAAEEVAVERAQAHAAGIWREAHADARTAGTLEQARAAGEDVRERAAVGEHGQYLLRSRRDGQAHARGDGLAAQQRRDLEHIEQGRIRARADADLIDLRARERRHGHDIVRAVRAGDHGLERVEVDVDDAVIVRVRVALQRGEVRRAPLGGEKCARHGVRREDRRRRAELRAHVRDRRALGHGQRRDARTAPLDDRADAALDRQDAQQLEADVLGGDERAQRAGEVDLEHFRHGDVVRAAAHGDRDVHAARAEGQHTDAAAGGRVAVRADERLAGLAEALEVHLMADAVAGAREPDAMLCGHGLQVAVVVRVFKAGLQRVVVDVGHAQLGLYARDAHRLELEIGHRAGRVLRERLVNAQGDLAAGGHVAVQQMCTDDFLCQCLTHGDPSFRSCFFLRGLCVRS